MTLSAEEISTNWNTFINLIDTEISADRNVVLLKLFNKFQDRLMMYPNSHKPQYYGAYYGGFIHHTIQVYEVADDLAKVYKRYSDNFTFTDQELKFVSLVGELGKFGTFEEPAFIENTSEWHKTNRGELFMFNDKIPYMSVSDRTLWLLSQLQIQLTNNEYLAIKLYQGMYEESNKQYLTSYIPEARPRTSLVYIINQAETLVNRIEHDSNHTHLTTNVKSTTQQKQRVKIGNGALSDDLKNFFN